LIYQLSRIEQLFYLLILTAAGMFAGLPIASFKRRVYSAYILEYIFRVFAYHILLLLKSVYLHSRGWIEINFGDRFLTGERLNNGCYWCSTF